jgi:hypothetical protein
MTEILRLNTEKQLRGWRLAASVAIGLCCKVIVPALQIAVHRGNLRASMSVSRTPPCTK